ncbi:hypothetical protein [Streptomyces sp. Isolate_45]|uniref:hypothetical protein n=1 Tax=Streptomyces sp. Isolate_45 TaxID=2950111 RepID=UPI002481EE13|nr:hypothetical protein [Streptomyces sp. Isolate_45]MDA5285587.1 hypothetical protein [Streptomyces sp. Isolate_45]
MTEPLMGIALLLGVVAAGAGMVVLVVTLNSPSPTPLRWCAVLPLVLAPSAAAVYCYGWLSVRLGGPFPELCEDRNASGAGLAGIAQEGWPLRNACVYSDGSTVEHVSPSITVLVCVLAGLAVVLTCAAAYLRGRARRSAGGTAVRLP